MFFIIRILSFVHLWRYQAFRLLWKVEDLKTERGVLQRGIPSIVYNYGYCEDDRNQDVIFFSSSSSTILYNFLSLFRNKMVRNSGVPYFNLCYSEYCSLQTLFSKQHWNIRFSYPSNVRWFPELKCGVLGLFCHQMSFLLHVDKVFFIL